MISLRFLGAAALAAGCREETLPLGRNGEIILGKDILAGVEEMLPAGFPVQLVNEGVPVAEDSPVANGASLTVIPMVVGG